MDELLVLITFYAVSHRISQISPSFLLLFKCRVLLFQGISERSPRKKCLRPWLMTAADAYLCGRMPAALFFAGDTKNLQRAIIFAVRNGN
jgi:hypothetical protein